MIDCIFLSHCCPTVLETVLPSIYAWQICCFLAYPYCRFSYWQFPNSQAIRAPFLLPSMEGPNERFVPTSGWFRTIAPHLFVYQNNKLPNAPSTFTLSIATGCLNRCLESGLFRFRFLGSTGLGQAIILHPKTRLKWRWEKIWIYLCPGPTVEPDLPEVSWLLLVSQIGEPCTFSTLSQSLPQAT